MELDLNLRTCQSDCATREAALRSEHERAVAALRSEHERALGLVRAEHERVLAAQRSEAEEKQRALHQQYARMVESKLGDARRQLTEAGNELLSRGIPFFAAFLFFAFL